MNNKELHVVVGGSGAMGSSVIRELLKRNLDVKSIGRKASSEKVKTEITDIFKLDEYKKSLKDASHVYLMLGLDYNTDYWLKNWPIVMKNTIEACIENNCKLIFLDNIYMYSFPLKNNFDENTEQNTNTKKGIARKITADLLIDAIKSRKLKAIIARSASFYGQDCINSFLYTSFLQRILEDKNPQSLFDINQTHTYSFIDDNAKAILDLALDETCYGEVWHLPVGAPISLNSILEIMNSYLGKKFKISQMPKFMLSILSIFIPILKEVKEMMYQFESPYSMSYEKFKKKFPNFKVTPYTEGIKIMIDSFKDKK